MPRFALAAAAVFAALAFGWRSVVHWRQTGSSGFRGFSGTPGSREWWGGVLFVVTLLLVPLGPVADLQAWLPRIAALDGATWRMLGVACWAAGTAGTLWAQLAMGTSWRVGVDPAERTALVTAGPFGVVRNPIYAAMGVALVGFLLLVPNVVSVLAIVCLVAGLQLHVRLVEEPYLMEAHGETYRRYARATGRFVPGLGRLR
jgi:protein-S-isoprenylcysteine O-methyltransferase Ste14